MIPQSNATLLSVSRGGDTEDYDRPGGSPTPVWTGSMEVYVQRKIVSQFSDNEELRRLLDVTLYVSADLPVKLEPGDTLIYEAGNPSSPDTLAGVVQTFVDPAYLPMLQDYFKVALQEVNVP